MKTMSPRYQLRTGGRRDFSRRHRPRDGKSGAHLPEPLRWRKLHGESGACPRALTHGRRNLRVDTLFLDEGFGTLDEDTLNKALYALETLQKSSGKLIGIISHVKSIRERIDAQIVVTKRPGSGRSTLSGPGVTKIDAE